MSNPTQPVASKPPQEKGGILVGLGSFFTAIAQKFLPDALVFAIFLSVIVFLGGLIFTDSSFIDMIIYWGDGIWNLLAFAMQVSLTLVLSHILANTRPVARFLDRAASIPKNPVSAVMLACVVTMICSLLSWGFGLIMGAIYARAVARKVDGIDYPMLVAGSYCGFLVWHGGLSGTIPLTLATPGSWTEPIINGLIPVTETMLSPLNIFLIIFYLITLPFIVKMMVPPKSKARVVDPELLVESDIVITPPENPTPAQKWEHSRIPSTLLGLVFLIYLIFYFARNGIMGLNLNIVNLGFFALGLLLVSSPIEYVRRTAVAATNAGNLLIQFPLYAGIMGMMTSSGLGAMISQFFISIANADNLPNVLHISSSILNMFIPSGGGKFAVEAPIYLPAAISLGANIPKVAVACAWGDALTNLIQPFWALPLLAIAKLGIRDIMGYCAVATIYGFITIQLILWIF
ncbi:MAG TPA: short-chain fatty acid transporter [Clostridia bacterium]|nr:short-chain fatty acid transporter [Clostridia bacterium]